MNSIIEFVSASTALRKPLRDDYDVDGERADPGIGLSRDMLSLILDEIDIGLIVTDAEGRLRHVNRAGSRACARSQPFCLSQRVVHAANPADAPRVERALRQAESGCRSMLSLDGALGPCFVAFVPIAQARCSQWPIGNAVLLMLGKQQICGPLTAQFFGREHGVTPAESAVLSALCNGLSPKEIAEDRGVAVSTVRTFIRQLRLKTGASSIRELIRSASRLPPMMALTE